MRIAVIGNGILGLMLARLLARHPDDQIILVGARGRECAATLAAAAMLNSFAELEHDSLQTDLERFKFELSREATRRWRPIIQALAGRLGERCSGFGTYVINSTTSDDLDDENFLGICRFLVEYEESHRLVDPSEIPNYRPDARSRATRAVFIDNEGWVNPKQFVKLMEDELTAAENVQTVDQNAAAIRWSGTAVKGFTTTDGHEHDADVVVAANGARLSELLAASALPVQVQRVFFGVGVSLELQSDEFVHERCIRTPNLGQACGIYTVPYSSNSLLVGASNFITQNPEPFGRVVSVSHLLHSAMAQINRDLYRARLASVNVGWRPTSTDTFPLIGPTSIKGLFIMGATKRDGFHLSPILAEVMASMIHGEKVDPRFEQLRPERQPIRWLTREQAIKKAIRHQVNAAYQHEFRPARGRMLEDWSRHLRDDLERLHDAVGAKTWGIPPEMIDMYRYGHAEGNPAAQ